MDTSFERRLTRSIRDPLHGTIYLTDEEVSIIDHALFRRLHHIRQNGLLYLVFPSASHTRFEHSLGVMHVADRAFSSLIRNSIVASHKAACADSTEGANGVAIPFHNVSGELLGDLRRLVRLASLVHDLGHGPLSHTFDSFAPKRGSVINGLESKADKPIEVILTYLKRKEAEERIEHEEMSCLLFGLIWRELEVSHRSSPNLKNEDIPALVGAVILGKPELVDGHSLQDYIPLLHDLIASAPVDADRMDYMERDSASIGVTYGVFDKDRVLKSFLVFKSAEGFRLGIKRSGLRAVENFVQARFELFVQIYYHKTNRAVQLMLKAIASEANKQDIQFIQEVNSVNDLVESYTGLSDIAFVSYLTSKVASDRIRDIARKVNARQLWKRIAEGKSEHLLKVKKVLEGSSRPELLMLDDVEPKATKDLDGGAQLLVRNKHGIYRTSGENWKEASPVIKALAEQEEKITRIFYRGPSDDAKKLRKEARNVR